MELPQRQLSTSRIASSDSSVSTATTLGLILFISSTYWFKKQHYAHDKNLFNYAMFGLGSLFSSMAASRFLIESPYAAAARRNNIQEVRHQRALGHIWRGRGKAVTWWLEGYKVVKMQAYIRIFKLKRIKQFTCNHLCFNCINDLWLIKTYILIFNSKIIIKWWALANLKEVFILRFPSF